MMKVQKDNALGWFQDMHALAPSGAEKTMQANDSERQALAVQLDIPSVESCEVSWTIKPWHKNGVRVIGTLRASVTQACSVTLEPVPGEVFEDIDVRLTTNERLVSGDTTGKFSQSETLDFDPEGRDPPELFDGARIPLGDIAYEHLALGLDPYPRAPEIAFDGFESVEVGERPNAEVSDAPGSAFSALAQWNGGKPTPGKN